MAAELRFEHEFTVEVPLEQAWRALAGPRALTAALGEGDLRAVDGVHVGRVELDASRNLACEATIAAVDQDDDEHVATISVHGRQVDGPAVGSVILRSRLAETGTATKVTLTADVLTTGHDPGNGYASAAQRLFEVVAHGLERQARETPAAGVVAAPEAASDSAQGAAPTPVPARGAGLERLGGRQRLAGVAAAAGLALVALALRRSRRRRRLF